MKKNRRVFFRKVTIFFTILLLTFLVRWYLIGQIPGEWFGDISNVHEYETQILQGDWPFYFFQSPGPLYHYLIVPFVLLYQNHGFETYKMASIAVSILGLAAAYFFAAEISTISLALVTTLTMSISLWFLIWSRLGNSQIVIPALVSFMSLFIARYVKKRKLKDLLFGAVFASLGWYTYPQTFIFPIVFFIFIIFYLVIRKKFISQFKSLAIIFLALIIMAIPFLNIIRNDKGNFGSHGYVGEKVLPVLKLSMDQIIGKTLFNWEKVFFMLHVRGDQTFRVNVSGHSQLDKISGIFFLLGFLYFVKKKRKIWLFFILWMLFVLPLPSISPVIPDAEIPNSARTIAVVPFVFLLVSAGFLWIYKFLLRFLSKYKFILIVLISIIYAYMVFTNLRMYFIDYTNGLPDRNLAPGKIIAGYMDTLPNEVGLYFGSCCWGAWGEPEAKGIIYVLKNKERFVDGTKLIKDCDEIIHRPAVVLVVPGKKDLVDKFMQCSVSGKTVDIVSGNGILVSRLIFVN